MKTIEVHDVSQTTLGKTHSWSIIFINVLNNRINYAVFTNMLHWVQQVLVNFTATNKMQYVTTSKIHMADRYYPQGGENFFGRNFRPLGAQQGLE